MKKFILLFLLIPFSISARSNVEATIECSNEVTIGNNVNCKLVIENPYRYKITDVTFDKNNKLLNINSNYELFDGVSTYTYTTTIDSREEKITLLTFSYLMEKNHSNIAIDNFVINTTSDKFEQNVSKILEIENISYADMIYINGQPLADMNRDVFDYTVNVFERLEYIELKVVTSGNNRSLDGDVRLLKYTPTLSFKVSNDKDTETYNISFNYKNPDTVDEIKISDIPFQFIPTKRYYYLEVENNVSKINIESSSISKEYNLNVGKNDIRFDNNGDVYRFVINRLKATGTINDISKAKAIKFGNIYLNIRDDVYEYRYLADEVDLVTVETVSNQDYEIKYNSDKVKITIYDAKQNKSEYTINLIKEDDEEKKEIQEYDNSKNIVVFFIFLLSFILITLVVIVKYKKERIN